MEETSREFEKELPKLISNEEYVDGALELINTLLEDVSSEIADAIPVAKSLRTLYKAGRSIRDRIFLRKLAKFLIKLPEISQSERNKYTEKIVSSEGEREKLGATLTILLDRFDDLKKPELLAYIFDAFIKEEINFETFQKMGSAIDKCFVSDLHLLEELDSPKELHSATASSFYMSGLTEIASVLPSGGSGALNKFQISDFGKQFWQIINSKKST
jgi:hypothetical protein